MQNIIPHVCRHTCCTNMAKTGINPKILQYFLGESNIPVTMNVYTQIIFDDAEEKLKQWKSLERRRQWLSRKINGTKDVLGNLICKGMTL